MNRLGEAATPLRLIVFDCDGTLVDSQHAIVTTMTAAFAAVDLPPPGANAIRALIGLSLEETMARLWPHGGAAESAVLIAAYRRLFFEQRSRGAMPDQLFPHADTVLRQLDTAGYLLGVATGKSRRGLDAVLASHNLQKIFLTRQTADGHPGKPHPSMLLQAMAEAGVEAGDTLMLGDTSFDMAMAVNAGVTPVGVAWGNHGADILYEAGARMVLEDFRDLLPCVSEQWPVL
ncbi:MAG: HAD-IA family hydrolase [Alphaproteobacteria bacterium]|nr:HAD-IA family hydrolase [Alphaproteobacteria bacterium]MBL6954063.1 HAD-IA family hydrolase [Alphaproteobacteria bacterium]